MTISPSSDRLGPAYPTPSMPSLRAERRAEPHAAAHGPTSASTRANVEFNYRGVAVQIDVEQTPDCVFGRADLFEDRQFRGRLSIGNPKATPKDVQQRLALLARAKVDTWHVLKTGDPAN